MDTNSQLIAEGIVVSQVTKCEQRNWGLGPRLKISNGNGVTPRIAEPSKETLNTPEITHQMLRKGISYATPA